MVGLDLDLGSEETLGGSSIEAEIKGTCDLAR